MLPPGSIFGGFQLCVIFCHSFFLHCFLSEVKQERGRGRERTRKEKRVCVESDEMMNVQITVQNDRQLFNQYAFFIHIKTSILVMKSLSKYIYIYCDIH